MYRILLQTLEGRDFLGIFNADGITITDNASNTAHNLWVTNTVVRNLRTGIALRRKNLLTQYVDTLLKAEVHRESTGLRMRFAEDSFPSGHHRTKECKVYLKSGVCIYEGDRRPFPASALSVSTLEMTVFIEDRTS
jgi:hypothetical protein